MTKLLSNKELRNEVARFRDGLANLERFTVPEYAGLGLERDPEGAWVFYQDIKELLENDHIILK